jgi:hypothetical protein
LLHQSISDDFDNLSLSLSSFPPVWISVRELHHHTSCRSDDLPSQKNILQAEGLDLLPVFRRPYHVHLEEQKKIVSQHHHLEYGFIGPEEYSSNDFSRYIVLLITSASGASSTKS